MEYINTNKQKIILDNNGHILCTLEDNILSDKITELLQIKKMNNRIFLGGTCNNSTWRNDLIPLLKVDYFNPVVEDWTKACQDIEIDEKNNKCNIHLYVITKEMKGVFSIAEAVNSAHDTSKTTIFVIKPEGFDKGELKSLKAVSGLISGLGGYTCIGDDLSFLAKHLNHYND